MSDRFEMTVSLGTVAPALPTGNTVTSPDGWSWLEMTDRVVYDHEGREVSREKPVPVVRWRQG